MSTFNIEKDIRREEMKTKNKYIKPIARQLDNNIEKIIESVLKKAKKEKIELERYDVESIVEDFWTLLSEDIEYVPGYVDEYVEEIQNLFYKEEKLSLQKISQYIINKFLG